MGSPSHLKGETMLTIRKGELRRLRQCFTLWAWTCAAHASTCDIAALLLKLEKVQHKPAVASFAASHQASTNGGHLFIRRLGNTKLLERVDYAERGENWSRILVDGSSVLLEQTSSAFFVVNEEPDARLEQSRVMNRVVICNAEVIRSALSFPREDPVDLSREVVTLIAIEPQFKKFLDRKTLETIELAVDLR
jgi:hypothetical protein